MVDEAQIKDLPSVAAAGLSDLFAVQRDGLMYQLSGQQLADLFMATISAGAPEALDAWLELVGQIEDNEDALTALVSSLAAKASLTGAETLTNKTIPTPVLTLAQSASPTPSAEGRVEWDTAKKRIAVGNGSSQAIFGQVTPLVAYSPTFTGFGTVSAASIFSRRVGDCLQIKGRFTGGTSTAVEARVSLGFNGSDGGLTVDSSKVPSIQVVGSGGYSNSGAAIVFPQATGGDGYITFGLQASGSAALTKVNGDNLLSSGVTMSFYSEIPITGW